MQTYRTAELWGRIAADAPSTQRDALRAALVAGMRAQNRVLWGLELMAVPSNPNTYSLGHTAGAAVVDGVYGQVADNFAVAVVGDGAEIPAIYPDGSEVGTVANLYDALSCAIVVYRTDNVANLANVCVRGRHQPTYDQIRDALRNGGLGWDRFTGLVIGRARFDLVRRYTVTITGPLVAGDVFLITIDEGDGPVPLMTYTVGGGDDVEDVAAGMVASLTNEGFTTAFTGVAGVFTFTDNVTPDFTAPEYDLDISTTSAAGDIGLSGDSAVTALVWTLESERQCATLHDDYSPGFGTPQPRNAPAPALYGSAVYDDVTGHSITLTDQNTWYVFDQFEVGPTSLDVGASGFVDLPAGNYRLSAHGSFDVSGGCTVEMAVCVDGVPVPGLEVRDVLAGAATGANFGMSLVGVPVGDGESVCFRVRRTSAVARDVTYLVLCVTAERIHDFVQEN